MPARVASNIGEVWLALGDMGRALSSCQQGLGIAQARAPRSAGTADALDELVLVQLGNGDVGGALALSGQASRWHRPPPLVALKW